MKMSNIPTLLRYDPSALQPAPQVHQSFFRQELMGYLRIDYAEADGVGFLSFPFYNGAMGTQDCRDLLAAYHATLRRPTRVLVLMGGGDFWSNGMHLGLIEAARSPAEEAWSNIETVISRQRFDLGWSTDFRTTSERID